MAEEAEADRIREATRTGRPLGEKRFVQEVERLLRRRLTVGKPGRPPRGPVMGRPQERLSCQKEIGL